MIMTHRNAPASSPVRQSWYTVVEMVAVLPGVYPAIIEVAPYSPSARANDSTTPARRLFQQLGTLILQKMRNSEVPRQRAASESVSS